MVCVNGSSLGLGGGFADPRDVQLQLHLQRRYHATLDMAQTSVIALLLPILCLVAHFIM